MRTTVIEKVMMIIGAIILCGIGGIIYVIGHFLAKVW